MVILQIATFILIPVLLMNMMAMARPWKRTVLPGKPLQTVSLGLLPKLLAYRSTLLALLMGCIVGVAAGFVPLRMALMVGVFAVVIVLMPVRYSLTTKGVAVGEMSFRSWDEFSGFQAGKSSLQLVPVSNSGRLTLFIKPAEMDTVLKFVERHVKIRSFNS